MRYLGLVLFIVWFGGCTQMSIMVAADSCEKDIMSENLKPICNFPMVKNATE